MTAILDEDRRCALYARSATVGGEADSVNEQVTKLTDYCSGRGWKNITVYKDEGFSGNTFKRPAFKKLIADVQAGLINAVVVEHPDRFTRQIINITPLLIFFQAYGVDVFFLADTKTTYPIDLSKKIAIYSRYGDAEQIIVDTFINQILTE